MMARASKEVRWQLFGQIMEPWFSQAKAITQVEADVFFLLHDSFYYGSDRAEDVMQQAEVERLKLPSFSRRVASMARTVEAIGHEHELASYYAQVLSLAKKYKKKPNEIAQYFWLRFWIWNTAEKVNIGFPWYDNYSEVAAFITKVSAAPVGEVFWDCDQSWEIAMHLFGADIYVRERDPDEDETRLVVRFPRDMLVAQFPALDQRVKTIVGKLSEELGRDFWTSGERNVRKFSQTSRAEAENSPVGKPRPWWKFW